jgi:hypothetical protein
MNKNEMNESLTNNHVVGVIHGEESARQASQELEQRYPNPVVLSGEEGARQIDAKGEHGGVFSRIFSIVEDHLSEATNYLKQYEAEARNGNCVVAVEVPSREEAEPVREVLERNGAHNIRFFGRLAVTDLSPQTNPSARSDESPEKQQAT